jgi:threonine dehydrogenase-like Zn-dependent dehydrogenase
MEHEFIGIVESIGTGVRTVKRGDLVVAPFTWSDGTCEFCQQGLQTSCLHGGWWGGTTLDGGQGEAVRVPQADGTLVALPVGPDHALMPSLLTLSDGQRPSLSVAGERTARHDCRGGWRWRGVPLRRHCGLSSGDAVIERVRELTSGLGAHSVLECVGHGESMRTAVSIARAGGAVGRVGVPQETTIPNAQPTFAKPSK